MQLNWVGITDGDTVRSLDCASGPPTALTLLHPKQRGGGRIERGVWRVVARTCLRDGETGRVLVAPGRFSARADSFHDDDHAVHPPLLQPRQMLRVASPGVA